jgi:lipid-binding SYLF domain-containing protein
MNLPLTFFLPQVEKAAKILQSFLADPNHPESALNSIPKEVLNRAKGCVCVLPTRGEEESEGCVEVDGSCGRGRC